MRVWPWVVLAGCSSPSGDVTGPFTGEVRRYIVDGITIPRDTTLAAMLAACDNGIASLGTCQ